MEFTICPLCGSSAIKKKKGSYKFDIKGEIVHTPVVEYWECPDCNEAFFDRKANVIIDEALLHIRKPEVKKKSSRKSLAKKQL